MSGYIACTIKGMCCKQAMVHGQSWIPYYSRLLCVHDCHTRPWGRCVIFSMPLESK
jgi:hypothetical protein